MKSFLLASLTLLSFTAGPIASAEGTDSKAIAAQSERAQVDEAKLQAKSGSPASAEQTLLQLSKFQENTVPWHMEAARRLAHMMDDVTREGSADSNPVLISRILYHLQRANILATNDRERASARSFMGFVYERLVGDVTVAKAHYEAAAQLNPRSRAAVEKIDRLKQREEAQARDTGSR